MLIACGRRFRRRQESPHPLGPVIWADPLRHRVYSRLMVGLVLIVLAVPLIVATSLTPDEHGLGTHRQLGQPACGFLIRTGVPCPTCGMTTAFAHAVRADWVRAFRAQPFGLVLAFGAFAGIGLTVATMVTGQQWRINWYRVSPGRVALVVLLLGLIAWVYKIVQIRSIDSW